MADDPDPAPPSPPITPEEQIALGAPLMPGTRSEIGRIAQRRDRLLAAFTLIAGIGLALGTPFALKSGA